MTNAISLLLGEGGHATLPPLSVATLGKGGSTASPDPLVTASMTPHANRTFLAAFYEYHSTTPSAPVSLTGWGLTWTLVQDQSLASPGTRLFVYRASKGAGAPTPGVLTMDIAGAAGISGWGYLVVECLNVNPATNDGVVQSQKGSTNNDTITVNLAAFSALANGTLGFVAAQDNTAAATVTMTAGSGFTKHDEVLWGTSNRKGLMCEFKTTNDTSVDASTTAASDGMCLVAMELKAG